MARIAQASGSSIDRDWNCTMDRYVSVGLGMLAGALLFEAALVPGMLAGGGAWLAPRYLPGFGRRPERDAARLGKTRRVRDVAVPLRQSDAPSVSLPSGLRVKQAVAKTITFRIIVIGLDFTTNYVVLGE